MTAYTAMIQPNGTASSKMTAYTAMNQPNWQQSYTVQRTLSASESFPNADSGSYYEADQATTISPQQLFLSPSLPRTFSTCFHPSAPFPAPNFSPSSGQQGSVLHSFNPFSTAIAPQPSPAASEYSQDAASNGSIFWEPSRRASLHSDGSSIDDVWYDAGNGAYGNENRMGGGSADVEEEMEVGGVYMRRVSNGDVMHDYGRAVRQAEMLGSLTHDRDKERARDVLAGFTAGTLPRPQIRRSDDDLEDELIRCTSTLSVDGRHPIADSAARHLDGVSDACCAASSPHGPVLNLTAEWRRVGPPCMAVAHVLNIAASQTRIVDVKQLHRFLQEVKDVFAGDPSLFTQFINIMRAWLFENMPYERLIGWLSFYFATVPQLLWQSNMFLVKSDRLTSERVFLPSPPQPAASINPHLPSSDVELWEQEYWQVTFQSPLGTFTKTVSFD